VTIAAVILAAGRSTRMGANKMLADLGGRSVVRRTAEAVLASRARPVLVVSGHEPARLAEALAGLDATIIDNPAYADGLSTSLIAGTAAVPPDAEGAVICLGDMPLVAGAIIDALIARFSDAPDASAVVPVHRGEWGNPVLLSRRLFAQVERLSGDVGARKLLQGRADVAMLDVPDDAVLLDADTPQALALMRARLGG
jgi:molybdenum cofactor cytidylyltransferase